MADKQVLATADDIAKIVEAAVEAARKPIIDPVQEQRKEEARMRFREIAKISENRRLRREASCNHRRENETSAICWYPFEDGKGGYHDEGVCQHCRRHITPQDADYISLKAISVGGAL